MWMNTPLGIPTTDRPQIHGDRQRMRVIEDAAAQAKYIVSGGTFVLCSCLRYGSLESLFYQ